MVKVVDASVVVNALTPGPRREASLAEMLDADLLAAPALIDAEVLSSLARLERSGRLSAVEARFAVEDWAALPIERFELPPLLAEVWSMRHNASLADAFYAALAIGLDCPLITSDGRLSRAPIRGLTTILVSE